MIRSRFDHLSIVIGEHLSELEQKLGDWVIENDRNHANNKRLMDEDDQPAILTKLKEPYEESHNG